MAILYIFFLCGYLILQVQAQNVNRKYPDYSNHPCTRKCLVGDNRQCYYKFNIQLYFAMMPDCLNCTKGPQFDKDCYNPECIVADGRDKKEVKVFNALLPGPALLVCKNDEIVVDFENMLDIETSTIHWHGIHQRNSQWMDGVPMVTQCPVLPATTYRYRFTVDKHGTFFYHSHSGSQRTDGAYGHLIVREPDAESIWMNPKDPSENYYDFDLSDHVISVTDWFFNMSEFHLYNYLRDKDFYAGSSSALLLNGFGCTRNNSVPCKSFDVAKNSRYRFRLIHAGAVSCPVNLTIEGHKFEVIASDGRDIEPVTVDTLTYTNGERFDIVIDTRGMQVKKYTMQFVGDGLCAGLATAAFLNYKGAPNSNIIWDDLRSRLKNPITMNCIFTGSPNCVNYDQMSALEPMPSNYRNPPYKYFLALDILQTVEPRFVGVRDEEILTLFINNITYKSSSSPLLVDPPPTQDFCNFENPCDRNQPYCRCTHIVNLPFSRSDPIEIIFVDLGTNVDETHPMHIHGYDFRVLGIEKLGTVTTMEEIRRRDRMGLLKRNYTRPIIKDNVAIPDGGYVIVRFIPDNPGFWLTHCHVDFHTEEGMQMVLKTGDVRSVPPCLPKCGNFLECKNS